MSKPILLAKNYFNALAYPDNTVSANEETAGAPASRVGRGSRDPANFWTPTTLNAVAWVQVQNDSARTADVIVIDRVHNLGGEGVTLKRSTTGAFAGEETTVFSATIPTTESSDADIDAANGVLTPEGAWLKRFTGVSDVYWRVEISAMGAGLKPEIGGLYLGEAWSLAQFEDLPFNDETYEVQFPERTLSSLWIGAGEPRSRRVLEMNLRLQSDAEYTEYRDNILTHYRKRRPMWVVHDPDNNAERGALFVVASGGRVGFMETREWHKRSGIIMGVEHEPKRGQ